MPTKPRVPGVNAPHTMDSITNRCSLSVRVPTTLRRDAKLAAISQGETLTEFVERAVSREIARSEGDAHEGE